MRGRDIKRYGYEFADLWLIATFPSKGYNIDDYPAVKEHLLSFGIERLEQTGKKYVVEGKEVRARKKTNNKWFETQDSISYWEDFSKQKIMYPNMTTALPFYLDDKGFMQNDKSFMITGNHIEYLCAFLNSKLFYYCFNSSFPTLGEKGRELRKIFFEKIPVKDVSNKTNEEFYELVADIQSKKSNGIDTTASESIIEQKIMDVYALSYAERDYVLSITQ